uniref:PEP/pyruvate-binding domain-containing protein n=1 Tax=Acetatifactor sp. TaxID=1872090 RepID=UPI004056A89E
MQKISGPLINQGEGLGNKGKFLCVMYQAGFPVPDGVILDSAEYADFIEENGIAKELEALLSSVNKENVKSVSARIMELFERKRLRPETRKGLVEELNESGCYAVRSSGTKEDLEEYSFAGQYQTFLNVKGIDAIETAIIDCYKSMFSEVSLNYLVNNEMDLGDMAMSVVIQEMVQSEYSGICFTINPITGNDKEMSIEVAPGLGENIVSGKVAPEQYYYNWYEKKGHFDEKNTFLKRAQLEHFGERFLKVQLLFGYPCDIEFAICEEKLYILQARRITKINYSGLADIWSTADFKDGGVSASVCTPYMWSLYEYIWEFTLRKFLLDSKILTEKEVDQKLGDMFYGRCYWNLSVVKLALSKVIGYKEREFDSEYGVRITYEGDGDTTKLTPGTVFAIARMFLAQTKILKERNENHENYKNDLLEKYHHYKEKYDKHAIEDIEKEWYHLTKKAYLQSEATYFWQIFINTVHQSLYKDSLLKYVSESEYLTLLGAIDNISHLLPFYEMWDISRAIRGDEACMKFWQEKSSEEIQSYLVTEQDEQAQNQVPGNWAEVCSLVRKLIAEYGYHSDKELDVTYPCYYEDVTPLLTGIRDMVLLGDEFSPLVDKEKGEAAYRKILQDIEAKVGKKKYQKIYKKIQNMRKMLWWREEYRDISTRFYYIIRIYTMELSKSLVKKGVLKEEDDIWFVKVASLWDYLDGKLTKEVLQDMVERNREYYNSYANYMSENEIGGVFGEVSEENQGKADGQVKGLGANSGRVTGTARVIEDFSQISRLQENDILVTRFTDTGWTPKFAILSGIVTEYGGILCHAAIVSREYGIPAIVSCHDVMKKIKDGQTITIDGGTGEITIEKE